MKGDLESTYYKAVAAIAAVPKSDLQKLSIPDCALTLSLLPAMGQLGPVRDLLATRLVKQLTAAWIQEGKLHHIFAVLNALWSYDPACITGEHLARTTQRLIVCEEAIGGPYRSAGKTTVAANVQIAIFMRQVAKPLPRVDAFLRSTIATSELTGSHNSAAWHVMQTAPQLKSRIGQLYLLAKACSVPALAQHVIQAWHKKMLQTPAGQALAMHLLSDVLLASQKKAILHFVCQKQQPDGLWPAEPLFKATPACGFTTTAFIVKILATYRQSQQLHTLQQKQRAIARAAKQLFGARTEPLRSSALTMIDQLCLADKNYEITLLPHFFATALQTPAPCTQPQYITLGLANVCSWIAYTIYDDFLDGGAAPSQLPVANVAMRESLHCFRIVLPNEKAFHQYVARVFAAMDEANAWEVKYCRFDRHADTIIIHHIPKYGHGAMLAARSFAHALTPLAVLTKCMMHQNNRYVETAFRHYLIAKQLNDDLHDWKHDLDAGQATYVVTAILRDMRVGPGMYSLPSLKSNMQKRFRHTTMPKICQGILRHTALSRQAFAASRLLQKTNNMYQLLDSLEQSVRQSLDQHNKAKTFEANGPYASVTPSPRLGNTPGGD